LEPFYTYPGRIFDNKENQKNHLWALSLTALQNLIERCIDSIFFETLEMTTAYSRVNSNMESIDAWFNCIPTFKQAWGLRAHRGPFLSKRWFLLWLTRDSFIN
jgi:hypothetical protein